MGALFSNTTIVPSGRTSTNSAPACFAARMARATSACVKVAGRRDIGLIDPVGKRKCHSPLESTIAFATKSSCTTLCTPRPCKRAIRRHKPCQHRPDELRGLKLLTIFLRKKFGISDEVTMDRGRELDGELHRFVVRNGGKLELVHDGHLSPDMV